MISRLTMLATALSMAGVLVSPATAEKPRIIDRELAERVLRSKQLSDLLQLVPESYFCIERPAADGRPVEFRCKTTSVARDHLGQAIDRQFADEIVSEMFSIADALGFGRSPFATCADDRGFVDARLQTRAGARGVASADMTELSDGTFSISGASAERMSAQCSVGSEGGSGPGGRGGQDARGGRPNLQDFFEAGRRLVTPERERLVRNARAALRNLSTCTASTRVSLIGDGAERPGITANVSVFFIEMAVRESVRAQTQQYFLGAKYEQAGTAVGFDVTRHKSQADPENSWVDVYGPGNTAGLPAGTRTIVNSKAPDGSTIVAVVTPDGMVSSHQTFPDGRTEEVRTFDGKTTIVQTYPASDPSVVGARPKVVVSEYAGTKSNRRLFRRQILWNDGSRTTEEFSEDGTVTTSFQTPPADPPQESSQKMPSPDNPEAGTCRGRARWVNTMLTFCDRQNWQPPVCMRILMLTNNCADPRVTRPGPDGADMVCRPAAPAQDARQQACERRGLIELVKPGAGPRNCTTPILKDGLVRDPGWIDPVPTDLRPLRQKLEREIQCQTGKLECRR
jgi:hypothetical protein